MGKVGTPRRKPGLMGPHVEGFRVHLLASGYTPSTVRNVLKDVDTLGCWLAVEGVAVRDLTPAVVEEFRAQLKARGRRRVSGLRSFNPLLGYLRRQGALAEPVTSSDPVEVLVAEYREWLLFERGLADATVLRYENLARRFLRERASADGPGFVSKLTGSHMVGFLLHETSRVSVGAAKGRVAELRALLRFLYLTGRTPVPLATAVPPVAGWHDTGIPVAVTASDV